MSKRCITIGRDRVACAQFTRCLPVADWSMNMTTSLAEAERHMVTLGRPHLVAVDADEMAKTATETLETCRRLWPSVPIAAFAESTPAGFANLRSMRTHGCDYMLAVPVPPADVTDIAKDLLRRLAGDAPALRVLVVDDSKLFRDMATVYLREFGCRVVAADTMEAGLQRIGYERIDVVVTDIFMPGIGGIEGIIRIRAEAPNTGIVAISGGVGDKMSFTDALHAARKIGADTCVPKPFNKERLAEAVAQAAKRGMPAPG